MNAITVTLATTGAEVSTDSELWRAECLQRHNHVQSMRSFDRIGRHDYVLAVRRREGDLAADRLLKAYGDDWQQRKDAREAADAAARKALDQPPLHRL